MLLKAPVTYPRTLTVQVALHARSPGTARTGVRGGSDLRRADAALAASHHSLLDVWQWKRMYTSGHQSNDGSVTWPIRV